MSNAYWDYEQEQIDEAEREAHEEGECGAGCLYCEDEAKEVDEQLEAAAAVVEVYADLADWLRFGAPRTLMARRYNER